MLPRRFYILCLTIVVIVTLVSYQTSLITYSKGDKYNSLRQILQFRNPDEYFSDNYNYNAPYVALSRNNTGNVAEIYINEKLTRPRNFNSTCALFPDFFNLRFKNDYWQMQQTKSGTFHLFNAYFDNRVNSSTNGIVRILGTYDVLKPQKTFFCQFWYTTSDKPKIVESEILLWMFNQKWGADTGYFNHPYLITCPVVLDDKKTLPVSVSLVEDFCQNATNNLKLFQKEVTQKKNFVVCVKGLSFPYEDKSARLTEWIELLYLLGADKINFYEFSVHPNSQKVLDFYTDRGLVEVTPLTLVGDLSNHPLLQSKFLRKKITPRRLQEVIPFNDCLYKHLEEFKYVVLLDTDEVIVPVEATWVELLQTLEKTLPAVTSYMARNVYFLDDFQHKHEWFDGIPHNMHMLQHVYRAKNYTKPGYFVKGFHRTDAVLALHNHFPFRCLKGCQHKEIDIKLAHLQHYRADCAAGVGDCTAMKNSSLADFRVWNFKDELISRVERTFRQLDFV